MSYESLKSILDRDLSITAAKPMSQNYLQLINSVVDYSTNFVSRVIDQKGHEAEGLVTSYLFIHIFELADAIIDLLQLQKLN